MAGARNADVNLTVRARTEGEKAITGLTDAVVSLLEDARNGTADLAAFGKVIGSLDKAAATLAAAQEKVAASATSQAGAIHGATAGIAQQNERIETLRRGLGILADEADKAFIGPRRDGLKESLQLAKRELADAERQVGRYTASLDRNLTSLRSSRSSLLDLKEAAAETSKAQKQAADALARADQLSPKPSSPGGEQSSLFGLKPYELKNLSYQVNDVVTGLASGQHLSQIIAQQGGQILQILPRAGGFIAAAFSNPAFLGAAAVITAIALGFKRAADEGERLRDITSGLKLSADGAVYDPGKLNAAAKGLESYGASAADATAAVKSLAAANISPDNLVAFGRAAQQFAEVTGTKLPEAAKQLSDAFTGGYQAIVGLDEKTNFLTAAQRENIRTLFEQGHAAEAQTQAFDIFSKKIEEAAGIQRGPATEAALSLAKAYNDLLNSLSHNGVIQGAIRLFGDLGDAISRATGNAAAFSSTEKSLARIAALTKQIHDLKYLNNPSGQEGAGLTAALAPARQELAQLQFQVAAAKAPKGAVSSDDTQAARKKASDRSAGGALDIRQQKLQQLAGQARINEAGSIAYERELAKSGSARLADVERNIAMQRETLAVQKDQSREAKHAETAAERLADRQNRYLESLDAVVDQREQDKVQLDRETGLVGKNLATAQRQAQVEDAIAKARVNAAKAGLTANDPRLAGRLAKLGAAVGAAFDSGQANKLAKFNELLDEQSDDLDDQIADQRTLLGLYGEALIAQERRNAVAARERQIRRDALRQGLDENDPGLAGQVSAAGQQAGADFDVKNAGQLLNSRLESARRPVEELENERNLLKSQAEFLRSIGENDAASKIDKQVRTLGGSLSHAYDELIQFYNALTPDEQVGLGILDPAQLDNIIAKLGQAKQASQEWGKILGLDSQQIAQAFAGAAANALNSFIERLSSGKNVFKSLGESVREFAASFISSIAQMVVQLLAFAAASSLLRALGVPIPTTAGILHTGGIAGSAGGQKRSVSSAAFASVLRYHNGGIIGIAPNEVPAILERDEEVLTRSDPRHRFNLGNGNSSLTKDGGNVTVINVPDHDAAVQAALQRPSGERVLINVLAKNKRAVKAALG